MTNAVGSLIDATDTYVDLFWIPLGAGTSLVRFSGKLYESSRALIERRPPQDLYHSALVATGADGRYVVEQAPVPDGQGEQRGVVVEGPVGLRWLSRFRTFRYEVRCWRGGNIPDLVKAVGGPIRITNDGTIVKRVIENSSRVPRAV